ncbi:type II secretion system F family protein [Thermincola ferriacetica]
MRRLLILGCDDVKLFSGIVIVTALALCSWALAVTCLYLHWLNKKNLFEYLGAKKEKRKKLRLKTRLTTGVIELGKKFAPVGQRFKLFVSAEKLERQLALAGNPSDLNVGGFLGLRFVLFVAGLLIADVWLYFGMPLALFVLIVLPMCGFVLPSIWINMLAKSRQEQIALDLPDFLDGMSVTLQAGVPLDAAMNQVVNHMEGPLAEELQRFNRELELGVPREEAYHRLVNRNECEELETLVQSLIQGSKLGVPIARTFKVMADDMRITRFNKVKEKAAKASPKVTLVTSFIITPGVMLAILGLIVLNIIYNPQFIGGGFR